MSLMAITVAKSIFKNAKFRASVFGILIFAILGFGLLNAHQAHAASGVNCDNNAVVFCGTSSVDNLISKFNNGDGHNSASSIHHIYSWFGISSSDVQSMATSAQVGSVTSSGDVSVDGHLVATNALTGGRQNIAGSSEQNSQGTIFFTRPPSVSFLSNSLSAFVVMRDGVFQFAILTSCGNPVTAHPVTKPTKPPTPAPTPTPVVTKSSPQTVCSGNTSNTNSGTASQGGNCSTNTTTVVQSPLPPTPSPMPASFGQCTGLFITPSQDNTMSITANVEFQLDGDAQLQSIVYNFGDGSVTPPTTQTTITHAYQQAGTFIITATLSFSGTSSTTPSTCQSQITINQVPAAAPSVAPAVVTSSTPPSTPVQTAPASQLVNTGPGSIVGIFAVSTIVGTLGYRLLLGRQHE